ncbi:MAG: homoserine kinase [Acidimicrobiales bacterium]
MRARAPASSANLGPGFDALAVAVDRYVEVEVEPSARLIVRSEGEGAGMSDDAGHLAARVAIDVAGHDRLAISVRSQIPVARGLGSSAALAAAAAAAAGARDPLAIAAHVDGHPENAAASVVGGLVVAGIVRGAVRVAKVPMDPALALVAVVPDRSLPTAKARQVLPAQVSREDAAFNLGRMGMLLAGLADHRVLVREAAEDRLHQDYRAPLFPEAPMILSGLLDGGALAVCWSGAGPTLLGICTGTQAPSVRRAGEAALDDAGVPGRVFVMKPDRIGLVTGEEARLEAVEAGPAATDPPEGAGRVSPGTEPGGARRVFDFDAGI